MLQARLQIEQKCGVLRPAGARGRDRDRDRDRDGAVGRYGRQVRVFVLVAARNIHYSLDAAVAAAARTGCCRQMQEQRGIFRRCFPWLRTGVEARPNRG